MKVTRYNLFESNSSSCHSLCIQGRTNTLRSPKFHTINDNYVEAQFGEYGWGPDKIEYPREKLSYALTMIMMTEVQRCGYDSDEISYAMFLKTSGFKLLDHYIKSIGYAGIFLPSYEDLYETNRYYPYGYIDHQSYEDYSCLEDFFHDYGITVEEYFGNSDVYVIIDNDNR